jgi:hypothetical protein
MLARRNSDETRESIATRDLLRQQWRSLLARWRNPVAAAPPPYLLLNGADARQAVRQAYQEFLEWARVHMTARAPHQTPSVYARQLGGLTEAAREPAEALTALYLRARYAADEMTFDEAQAAQSALVRLQELPVIQSPLAQE